MSRPSHQVQITTGPSDEIRAFCVSCQSVIFDEGRAVVSFNRVTKAVRKHKGQKRVDGLPVQGQRAFISITEPNPLTSFRAPETEVWEDRKRGLRGYPDWMLS